MNEKDENEKNRVIGGTLYLVATPIGNMADISSRAVKVLSEVDFVAAEDTRHTGLLLSRLGISRPMMSYYEENKRSAGDKIISRLLSGESCALCTDAGTPAISDPGADIVRDAVKAGINVTAVPGACAAVTALSISGADTKSFVFYGFLPTENTPRGKITDEISRERRTVILYEAPHRLKRTLGELKASCGGEREAALCRELTKLNEEVIRGTLDELIQKYEDIEPRGEYVIVLHGAATRDGALEWEGLSVKEHVEAYISSGMNQMDAIKAAARDRGVPKGEIYKKYAVRR